LEFERNTLKMTSSKRFEINYLYKTITPLRRHNDMYKDVKLISRIEDEHGNKKLKVKQMITPKHFAYSLPCRMRFFPQVKTIVADY
jgi:hypothetical protein